MTTDVFWRGRRIGHLIKEGETTAQYRTVAGAAARIMQIEVTGAPHELLDMDNVNFDDGFRQIYLEPDSGDDYRHIGSQ